MGEVENFEFNFSKALKLGPCGDVFDSKTPEEDVKKLVSDLQGLIECPVCLGRLDSSMRQCSNGHGICDSCSNKMRECPLCQSSFLPNKPIMIAKILDRLPKPCSFADKGCDKVSFTGRDEHEAFCKYRTTYCMFMMSGIHCDWSGTVEAVLDHAMLCGKGGEGSISKVYFPSVKVTHVYMFTPAENSTFYSAMVFEDQLFWKYCYRNSTTKMITWRFIHVAPSKPKKKYYLVVSFCKGEIEYKTCVEAYCETNGDQKDYKASLLLTDDSLKRFYDSKAKGYVCSECIVVENIVDEK